MQKLFGTDGVRGVVNEQITPKLCFNFGRTLGIYLNQHKCKKVIIGQDTRTTCDALISSICSGLMCQGVDIITVNVITTPALSYLTKVLKIPLGIMVTASHNSAEYNGIKVFDINGNKPSAKLENDLQKIFNNLQQYNFTSFDNYGKILHKPKLKNKYINYLRELLNGCVFDAKICFDMSNGASNYVLMPLLKEFFKDYVVIGDDKNGININNNCGATQINTLVQAVINNNCDFGFAYDGDADRVIMVNHYGKVLDGDDILFILAVYLKETKLLNNNTVVGTIMSNFGLENALKKEDIKLVRVKVGDKYIIDYLNKFNLSLGGEQAGHIIVNALSGTGDGVLTSLVLLKAIKYYGKDFDQLVKKVVKYPQVIKNVVVDDKQKQTILKNEKVIQALNMCEGYLLDDGRIVVRASGTEPLIRVMVEGKDQTMIEQVATNMVKCIVDNKN